MLPSRWEPYHRAAATHLRHKGKTLMPYQREGLEWALGRELDSDATLRGGILADEMGLGKTAQMLALVVANRTMAPTLVLAPLAVCDQWAREARSFTRAKVLVVTSATHAGLSPQKLWDADIVVCPHSLFTNVVMSDHHPVSNATWGRVIVDEAHRMKNTRTKLAVAAADLITDIRWCLTGTPVVSKSKDLDALVTFLRAGEPLPKGHAPPDNIVMRRTKEDVAHQLDAVMQPIDLHVDMVTMTPAERRAYARLYVGGRIIAGKFDALDSGTPFTHVLGVITEMRTMLATTRTKTAALAEQFDAHPPAARAIVFCNWHAEIQAADAAVRGKTDMVLHYHGHMSHDDRAGAVEAFVEDEGPRARVLIMQIEAGGVGLNLQVADFVYILSPHWNATSELQAIARAHRGTRPTAVKVVRIITKGTIEEFMHRKQQAKLDVAAAVLKDPRISSALAAVDGTCDLTWGTVQQIFESEEFDEEV